MGALAATAAGSALLEGRFAVLIVQAALLFVGQHLVGAGDLLEFFLRRLVARIAVRVELHRLLAVGFLDLIRRGAFRDAQETVKIFGHGRGAYLVAGPVETKTAAGRSTRSCSDQPGRATRVTEPSGTVSLASWETASWCDGLNG